MCLNNLVTKKMIDGLRMLAIIYAINAPSQPNIGAVADIPGLIACLISRNAGHLGFGRLRLPSPPSPMARGWGLIGMGKLE